MPEDVDAIIIGSGQGGVPLALHLESLGKKVVLFERDRWGGTCVNTGCTPSKAFLAAAHNAGRARLADPLGVHCEVTVDQRAVTQRVRRIRDEWHDGSASKLEKSGIDLVHAEASFTGERIVSGGGREVRAPIVVIDTGTTATVPDIEGMADVPYLTNRTWWDLDVLPETLLVLGGGYIGLELGQGARRLGSRVTVINFGPRIMEREEEDATKLLQESMEADGVRFVFCSEAKKVTHDGSRFALEIEGADTLYGDGLLVTVGRTPNTAALDCAKTGVELTEHGMVKVDEHLKTTCEGVYALGDVAGQPAFTHVSWEDFRRLKSTFAGTPRRRDDRVLSYTTFTEPQLARTGLTEDEARAKGIVTRSATMPLSDVARGTEWNLERGFFRLVVDTSNDKIVGATFVGYEARELIHVITAHIELGATWHDLDRQMYVHPTFCEGLPSLAREFEQT